MKNTFWTLFLLFAVSVSAQAQRIAIVDVEKVLESMDSYKNAQADLDKASAQWQQEITQKYDEIKGLYSKYQAEMVLLSDEAKRQREDEIMSKENAVRELQKKRFGPEGDLFKKRQELVQPIQEQVYRAIQRLMEEKGFEIILDKASDGVLASDPKLDRTSEVVSKLR